MIEKLDAVIELVTINAKDHGVTLFMPHITRSLIRSTAVVWKRLNLFHENLKKIIITADKLPLLHYKLQNPLENIFLDHILEKELIAVLWLGEPGQKIEETLTQYVKAVSEPTTRGTIVSDDFGEQAFDNRMLQPLRVDPSTGEEEDKDIVAIARSTIHEASRMTIIDEAKEETRNSSVKSDSFSGVSDKSVILIPPVWTPSNKEGNAMLLYEFFREVRRKFVILKDFFHLTFSSFYAKKYPFLPPEEVPALPHVCMILPASKQREVLEICREHEEDVLAMGFFTKDDLDETELICRTAEEYKEQVAKETDRIILKLAKKTSHCELAFINLNPIYISHDPVKGAEDCLKVFN